MTTERSGQAGDLHLHQAFGGDPCRVDVEADRTQPGLGEGHRERQAHVAEADDRDDGVTGLDAGDEWGRVTPGAASHGSKR